jgi:hypothetical protein
VDGVTLLQDLNTNLNGAGVRIGQVEADVDTNGDWEVDPANAGEPTSLFVTYYTNGETSTSFPNSLGGDSWHADDIGMILYDPASGVATNIAHVDNFEAGYYYNNLIASDTSVPGSVTDAVVNESFTFGYEDAATQEGIDTAYDNFSTKFRTLFVSAACNASIYPTVCAPGTSYNCISVGAYDGDSSHGPTIDNGRCKPDITALPPSWGPETSFSTPMVTGAAAMLMQAAQRGDGGSDTNSAANMITIKTLLLNGAVKPSDWVNFPPEPLDTNYGTGVLNVFNSYEQLAFGKHGYVLATNIPKGTVHPPVATAATVPVLSGWDFDTNNSTSSDDSVNHYFFNVTNGTKNATFTVTATLVWNRHSSKTAINNLALYLYNAANSNLVASSTSVVDNVQHVYVPQLAQGRYDLQVWKAGGSAIVSTAEPYGLAWEIFSQTLSAGKSGGNAYLSWPAYPAGFAVAAAASLNSPINWSTNNLPAPVYTNHQMVLWLSATNSAQFFRLQTPDF